MASLYDELKKSSTPQKTVTPLKFTPPTKINTPSNTVSNIRSANTPTTYSDISSMTAKQKRARLNELAPYVRSNVEQATPKKITDEMMKSGQVERNEAEYKAIASNLGANAFTINAIDQALFGGLAGDLQDRYVKEQQKQGVAVDDYTLARTKSARQEINPIASTAGTIAGGLARGLATYGTAGKAIEGALASKLTNAPKIVSSLVSQQAADLALETPVSILQGVVRGDSAGDVAKEIAFDQALGLGGNLLGYGLESAMDAFSGRNIKNASAASGISPNAEQVAIQQVAIQPSPKVTTIKDPYEGPVPQITQSVPQVRTEISNESLLRAQNEIEKARNSEQSGERSFKSYLKKLYGAIFDNSGGARTISVNNLTFGNRPYDVSVYKNVVGKLVSDGKLSAEKLSVLDKIDEIVATADYVGSGKYDISKGNIETIRYDYFEKPVSINGKNYVVSFDVQVFPGRNNYRTHKVINEIDLTPTMVADTGPAPAAAIEELGLSTNIIPKETANVNNVEELIEEYGLLQGGTQQPIAREIRLPKQTSPTDNVTRNTQTQFESPVFNAEYAERLRKEEVPKGTFSYESTSNATRVNRAINTIQQNGVEKAKKIFLTNIETNRNTADNNVLGMVLLKYANDAQDYELVKEISPGLALAMSESGRSLQVGKILKTMEPESRLQYMERAINRINANLTRKGLPTVSLNEGQAERILKASKDQAAEVLEEVGEEIAEGIRGNWVDKMNTWRYFAMLSNPRTMLRNHVGNKAFAPVRMLKNLVAAGIESGTNRVMEAFGAAPIQRTKFAGSVSEGIKKYTNEYFDSHSRTIMSNGKYDLQQGIMRNSNPYETEFMRKLTSYVPDKMEKADTKAAKKAFADSMGRYMEVNKLTPEFLESGTGAAEKIRDEAVAYATQEAKKATFRDSSAFAKALNNLKNSSPAARFAMDAIVPFTTTPINILRRGVEYSPLGVLNAVTSGAYRLSKGDISPAQFIDQLAAGLTGTGVVALGAFLASQGLINGSIGGTNKEKNYAKTLGEQEYSINIGDNSYTIDWLTPVVLPLMVGVELYNEIDSETADGSALEKVLNAVSNVSDPVFNLSMLQGLTDVMATFKSDPAEAILDVAGNTVENYASQFVPTVFGQAARTIDNTRRSTTGDKTSPFTAGDAALRRIAAKVPFASFLLEPYVDQWGREQQSAEGGNFVSNLVLNSFSPGYLRTDNATVVDDELLRLSESTGETSVLPGYAASSFTVDKVKTTLNPEKQTQFAKTRGQTAYGTIEAITNKAAYNSLPDTDKVKVINSAYEFANEIAKAQASGGEPTEWVMDAIEANQYGIPVSTYILQRYTVQNIKGDKNKKGETINGSRKNKVKAYINSLDLTQAQKNFLFSQVYDN